MRYLGQEDGVRGYITGGIKEKILPPNYTNALRHISLVHKLQAARAWIRHGASPSLGVYFYRRYVAERFGICNTHMTCQQVQDLVGQEIWNTYFKFTFNRNPWDRMISFYYWRTRGLKSVPSFFDFVTAIHQNDKAGIVQYNAQGFSNTPFYKIKDKICVNFVGKYEKLNNDIKTVVEITQLPSAKADGLARVG